MNPSSAAPPPPQDTPAHATQASPLAMSTYQRFCERRLARHFHDLRLSRSQRPDLTAARERPLIVYLNHSSWWDPLVCLQLAGQLLPQRRHYAAIDAEAVNRHPFLGRLGFFAIEPDSPRGARRFLEAATRILEQPDVALWITSGGGLADPRERPAGLQPGLGHVAARLRHGVLLPLALEYPFWTERLPEALARFGEELAVEDVGMRAVDWTEVLAARLEAAQDALAAEAMLRDSARFELMLGGGAGLGAGTGAGGVLRAWRRLRAALARRRRIGQDSGADPQETGG
jgi:1-acyl-sn-glycerol-3-phosphate acyltransferase